MARKAGTADLPLCGGTRFSQLGEDVSEVFCWTTVTRRKHMTACAQVYLRIEGSRVVDYGLLRSRSR